MSSLDITAMQSYLGKSYSSLNQNKLNGLLAEISFRDHLRKLGFGDQISVGGWIARSTRDGNFGQTTVALFPETIRPGHVYSSQRSPDPPLGLHTTCATMHQIGIASYFCVPIVGTANDPMSVDWKAKLLGVPWRTRYEAFPSCLTGFSQRRRRHNFLANSTPVATVPISAIPEEFSKECLRVCFQNMLFSELVDIDGILWGERFTYPIEIKEKTVAIEPNVGEYFGLDVGPFAKLAFFAARTGNLRSLFVVREIDNPAQRNLVEWWIISFEKIAEFASWIPQKGGTSMSGSSSAVLKIPKREFQPLTKELIRQL